MGRGLDYIHKMRGLTFVKVGMRIKAEDRQGVIQGENSSGNLSVLFDGDKKPSNVHPTWKTTYYAQDGAVVADFSKTE